MRSENGRAGPPQSALSACCPNAGGGGVSCALGVPAVSNRAPPTSEQAQILRFIVSSTLLSRVSKLAPQEIKRALLRLRQPHCFDQTILANQQINLNRVAPALAIPDLAWSHAPPAARSALLAKIPAALRSSGTWRHAPQRRAAKPHRARPSAGRCSPDRSLQILRTS